VNALVLDTRPARLALDRAEDAYTAAVRDAAHTGNWNPVQHAAEVVHHARAALAKERA
jgi:hypothetical protein